MKLLTVLLVCLCVYCTFPAAAARSTNSHSRSNREYQLSSSDVANNTVKDWFRSHPWIYGVIGGVALAIVVAIVIAVAVCVYCYRRRGPRQKNLDEQTKLLAGVRNEAYSKLPTGRAEIGVGEEFNRQKRRQQTQDREKAVMAVNFYLRNTQQYEMETVLSDMGSRIQKYWFKVSSTQRDGRTMLISIAPVSQRCPLKLDQSTLKTMKSLLATLQGHPYIHPIKEIEYSHGQVILVQPFCSRGSLKDVIYRATSATDWSMKYSRRSKGLSAEKVANYGRQVLEAMVFLYKQGFPVLGHVQSGNIFVQDGVCRVGGYENTLLGYKTRLYKQCKELLEQMDVIMFGHLLFEMACGYELTSLVPGDQEYKSVKNEQVKLALQFVFEDGFPHSLEEVLSLDFFQLGKVPYLEEFNPNTVKLTSNAKSLLKQVTKGKAQKQKQTKLEKSYLATSAADTQPNPQSSSSDVPKTSGDEQPESGPTSATGNPGSGQR